LFAVRDPKFWGPYKNTPAWEYERFIELAEKGSARSGRVPQPPAPGLQTTPEPHAQRLATQREDLDVSIKYTKELVARL
jgi:hypothetical protein